MRYYRIRLIIIGAVFLLHCAAPKVVKHRKTPVIEDGYVLTDNKFTGKSSWYGRGFHGRRTASGERFNMFALTAAHRTLPFGTLLKITNPATDKHIIVKVNDRGPFIRHRVLDLSFGAAKELGFSMAGTAEVKAQIVKVSTPLKESNIVAKTAPGS